MSREAANFGKGQMGSALMGPLQISCFFDRGTFWGTHSCPPESARAYLFPRSVETPFLRSSPISVDAILHMYIYIYIYIGPGAFDPSSRYGSHFVAHPCSHFIEMLKLPFGVASGANKFRYFMQKMALASYFDYLPFKS